MKKAAVQFTLLMALLQGAGADENRRLLLPLPHNAEVKVMAYSPSKGRLATGDRGGMIKIWNWKTRNVELSLQPDKGDEREIEWMGWLGEDQVIVKRTDYDFRIYDLVTAAEVAHIPGERRETPTLLGSQLVVVKREDDKAPVLEFLELPSGKSLRTLPIPGVDKDQTHWVKALSASPDRQRLALSLDPIHEGSNQLLELDAQSGQLLRSAQTEGYAPERIVYSPSGQSVAGNSWDVVVWTERGAQTHTPDRAGLQGVEWKSESELMYSINNDGATLHRIQASDMSAAQIKKLGRGDVATFTLSPEGTPTYATFDGSILNGDTEAPAVKAPAISRVNALTFHPTGRLVTGMQDGDLFIWNLATGKLERRIQVPGTIRGLALTGDGGQLAVATNHDNDVRIFDWKSGKLLRTLKTEYVQGAGYVLQFNPANSILAVLQSTPPGWSDDLFFYNVRTGEQVWKKESSSQFSFHPRENKVAVLRKGGMVEVDLSSGAETFYKLPNLQDCGYDQKGDLFALQRLGSRESRLIRTYPRSTGRLDEAVTVGQWSGMVMDQLQQNLKDGTWWMHANSGALYHVDDQGKILGRLPDGSTYRFPNSWQVLPGNLVALRADEGAVEFWKQDQGVPEGQLVLLEQGKNWLATSSNGFFDGTSEAERLLEWQVGKQRYRVDQFFEQGYKPGLLRDFYRGAPVSKAGGPLSQIKVPPKMEILSPGPGSRIEDRETEVRVRITDQGNGFSKPKIYVNGHAVLASASRSESKDVFVFKTRLSPGLNELRATSFDSSGQVESRGDKLRVTCLAAARRDPKMFVVAVGVNNASAGRPLMFAEKDAQAVAAKLRSPLYPDNQVTLLTGPKATKAALDGVFRQLESQAEPQDTVVVFFAGHGMAESQGYRFLLSGKNPQTDSLSSVELASYLETIPAHRQFVVLDTCHSAAASPDLAARFAVSQQRMARGSGTFMLAACRSDETAAEIPSLKHGLLTYSLLSGFQGKKGTVTVNSLIQYVSSEFPEISRKHSQTQELYQFSNGSDFPLLGPSGKQAFAPSAAR